MNCCICSKRKSLFKSMQGCSKKHFYHSKCLEKCLKESALFQMISSCEQCITEILPNYENYSEFCISCKSYLTNKNAYCNKFKHFCKDCDLAYIFYMHYSECSSCKAKHLSQEIESCLNCSKISCKDDLQLTICPTHYICSLCIRGKMFDVDCQPCRNWLNSENAIFKCSFCRNLNVNTNDLACQQGHLYCSECLLRNCFNTRCKDCEKLYYCVCDDKNIRKSTEVILEKKIPAKKKMLCEGCGEETSSLTQITQCKSHYYCENCLAKGNLPSSCINCFGHFNRSIQIPKCSICKFSQQLEFTCESNHSICSMCFSSIEQFPNTTFSNCLSCTQKINNLKTLLLTSSLPIVKIPSCDTTLDHISNITFLCNHNFCNFCISQKYLKKIKKFLTKIEKFDTRISQKFEMKCLVPVCKKKIMVPFEYIRNFFSSGEISRERMRVLEQFLPYFDGVKAEFCWCKCRKIVARMGKLRLNCKC